MEKGKEREEQEERVRRYLKGALKQAGVTYDDLAVRLQECGFRETKASIASKLSRGSFPATFLIAVLKAIGRGSISLSDI
jgi:Domain of unknown function (DUF6471)